MISVLIAAVGIVGTALGAVLTASIAARTEGRRQAALERQQVRDALTHRDSQIRELRLEHLRWRRERRQAAYLDLLTASSAADRANQQYFRELRAESGPVPVDEGRLAEIRGLLKGAEQIFYKVVLEGPGSVSEVAQKLVDQFSALVGEVRRFAEAQADGATDLSERGNTVEATGQIFMVLHREFLDAARTALDEIIDAP